MFGSFSEIISKQPYFRIPIKGDRGRTRQTQNRKRNSQNEKMHECVCVCMCVRVPGAYIPCVFLRKSTYSFAMERNVYHISGRESDNAFACSCRRNALHIYIGLERSVYQNLLLHRHIFNAPMHTFKFECNHNYTAELNSSTAGWLA